MENYQSSSLQRPSQVFHGIRFVLLGFDPIKKSEVLRKLVNNGGVDVNQFGPNCTHVIVDKLAYDDPICVAARKDGKAVVTGLWVDHSVDVGVPVDTTSIMYRPVKDLNGIPGAKSLVICLTGYQREDREDIMTMVDLMGAQFSKPLIGNKVTHLICYKFEGEKYLLAKKMKKIKLVNHRWLEDCLKAWDIISESGYSKSGYELEMEAEEAKDSEEEGETRHHEQKTTSPHHSLMIKQESNTSASKRLGNSVSNTTKTTFSHEFSNPPHEIKSNQSDVFGFSETENVIGGPSNGSAVKNKSPLNESGKVISARKVASPISNQSSGGKRLSKLNFRDAFDMSSSLLEEKAVNDQSLTTVPLEDGGKRKMDISSPSSRSQRTPDPHQELKKHPPADISDRLSPASNVTYLNDKVPAGQSPLSNIKGRKSLSTKGKSVICDVPISATETVQIEELDAVRKPLKEFSEPGFLSKFDNQDVGDAQKLENVVQGVVESSSRAIMSDVEKSSIQSGGLSSKPVRKKSVAKKNSAQNVGSKNQKGSIYLKNKNDDDATISPVEMEMNDEKYKCSYMDDETEPPEETKNGDVDMMIDDQDITESDKISVEKSDDTKNNVDDKKTSKRKKLSLTKKAKKNDSKKNEETPKQTKRKIRDLNKSKTPQDVVIDDDDDGTEHVKEVEKKTTEATPERSGKTKRKLIELEVVETAQGVVNDENAHVNDVVKKKQVASEMKTKETTLETSGRTKRKLKDLVVVKTVEEGVAGDENAHVNDDGIEHLKNKEVASDKKTKEATPQPSGKTKRTLLEVVKKAQGVVDDENAHVNDDVKKKQVASDKKTKEATPETSKRKVNDMEINTALDDENAPPVTEEKSAVKKKKKKNTAKTDKNPPNKTKKDAVKKTCDVKEKSDPMWFILSGHKLQKREFQQIIKRLKGRVCRVSHQWSYQATHFILPDPIRRTEKFFAAAASGRWILKTDYLSASNEAGKFVAEEAYEWHKNGLSEDGQINLEAPRKWRLLKEKTGHGAFHGMRIVIYGECIAPPLDTLKRAVKAGDGAILATSPPYTRFLNSGVDYAIVSPGMPHVDVWVQEFIRHEIPCISADYLVEYVCKPGYPLEKHVHYDTNPWALRSYKNLQNRLKEVVSDDDESPTTPESDDVACGVCGSRDRGEEMLICGDESGSVGCGGGTHIDCCDPPLEDVPEEDWFCSECSKTNKVAAKKKSRGK